MKKRLAILSLAVVCGVGAIMYIKRAPDLDRDALSLMRARLLFNMETLWTRRAMRRPDGYIYAVDVGHLLIHAAQLGDDALYRTVRDTAVKHLVRDERDDPYTRGFVGWRVRPGRPLDASGTTEALRIAKGLWMGGARFSNDADQALALMIVRGYGQHAYIDQGVWHIRNYFNFETRTFPNDSYLVDYDPDLLADMAEMSGDEEIAEMAEKSYAVIKGAVTPVGLLHMLIQPDMRTLMPDAPVTTFSPNDIIQVNNACTVALGVTRGQRWIAENLVAFVRKQGDDLHRSYYGRTGETVGEALADSTTWSCLVQLAARIESRRDVDYFMARAWPTWRWLAENRINRPFATTEALQALDAVLELWEAPP